ncbi:ExbD/TolR family protein [Rhodospirillaceae bacterium SYSU D60014]|uniref:ExbD/TolR family protein n=1 Tax=Virgifigura deserti TaxID=2268457 RepID=UPI000E666ABD
MNRPRSAAHKFSLRNDPARGGKRLISLTPLIDVVFILLIFFMLASSFLDWRAIMLDAPAAQAAGTSMDGAVLIRVMADGSLDLGGSPVTLDALDERLRPHLDRKPDQRVLIQPAAGVPLQRVVTVLDAATAAGVSNLSLTRN